MKKADSDPIRIGEEPEMHRLDAHPEAQRLEGHPVPESLPEHKEETPVTAPFENKVAATTDVQEAKGMARGAGWIALGILALMVVAAFLWPPRASQRDAIMASASYPTAVTNGRYYSGVPTYRQGAIVSDTIVELVSTVAQGQKPSAVVVYLFDTDSSVIPETAALTSMAKQANNSGKTVVIKAYTDETGRVAYNQRLSERRAKAVGDYMAAHGVPASHIKAKGYGPTHAYATNAQDRRAEVSLE